MSDEGGEIRAQEGLQISSMIEKIMANPELISMVASALGGASNAGAAEAEQTAEEEAKKTEPTDSAPLPSMEKLPELVAAIAPMLSAAGAKSAPAGKMGAPRDKRACLLTALKPYLSAERCEAIDYMIRLGALSEVFRGLGG